MCLIYNLQSKGVPVNEVYKAEVKDIPTERFGDLDEEEKAMLRQEEALNSSAGEEDSIIYSFYSDDSFEYIKPGFDF